MPVEEVTVLRQNPIHQEVYVGMNYQNEIRRHIFRIFMVCFLAIAAFAFWVPDAAAYGDYSGCGDCHGDFRATTYLSQVDGSSLGNLHNLHRTTMLSGDCDVCHRSGTTNPPVNIASSAGGTGLQAISCMGCHGRSQDAGHDSESAGLGAGLRQHHTRAGVSDCQGCHSDANPANYTPVGENVKPPYYANPGTGHPNMPTDSCNANPTSTGKETFAGSPIGLDNDGNDLYDVADPACASTPPPSAMARTDFDGDSRTDVAIWRPTTGQWWIRRSSDSVAVSIALGSSTDIPVPGDYDGDGTTDAAIWRPSTGQWWIQRSLDSAVVSIALGSSTDIPVPGDYDGDGTTDAAIWRASAGQWWIRRSLDSAVVSIPWGSLTDTPVPGDYDGDGTTDAAIWRASAGQWWILRSSDSAVVSSPWGSVGDIPIKSRY